MATTRTPTTPTRPTPTRTTQTRRSAGGALARCLEPVSAERFLADHWEQQPLVVERGEPGRYDDLLSEADVERLVCSTAIRYPAFRLVKEGAQLDVGAYTEDIRWRPPLTAAADVGRVAEEWESGATIVLQALHILWRPLAVFCRDLERTLGHPTQTNAYYTPAGSQGFAVHHDTHDVFVLQVAGEKRWTVYEPLLALPLKNQRHSKDLGDHGPPTHELTLRAGDTLYLPRGWLHEAATSETNSLHLTVGVNAYTWMDAFKAALDACAEEVAFRRAVTEDGIGGEELVELLRARLDPDEVAQRRRRHFVSTRRPILDGQLSQLRAMADLGLESTVERRPTVIAELEADGDAVVLAFEGKELRFPGAVRADVAFCAESDDPFRPADLPGDLDAESRLVLVRRLVREGLLRTSATDA
jgi:bifunctional lysine-specific demethylase and histidyl-hydroxylase NO66